MEFDGAKPEQLGKPVVFRSGAVYPPDLKAANPCLSTSVVAQSPLCPVGQRLPFGLRPGGRYT